jgi:hypothetical protein
MPCLAHLDEVQERLAEIRALGGELIAVSQAAPPILAVHVKDHPRPFPVVSDPQRVVYRAFGLERAGWAVFFRPRTLLRYLALMCRGWRPRRAHPGEDVLQLGGDFVLTADRRVVLAHRSTEPADRPAVTVLLAALRQAGKGRTA